MSTIGERILALHRALDAEGIPHAFGGALALAWCTAAPRGTSDIDLNIFVTPDAADAVMAALPDEVTREESRRGALERDGQVRLWWGEVPIDVFLDTTEYHREVAERVRVEPFLGAAVPFLACEDLAVFKAFFDRTRDWADLEDMVRAGALARGPLETTIRARLGDDDHRLARIAALPWPD